MHKISFLLLILTICSCNFFETRTPESPDGAVDWNIFFTNPSLTLDNLKYAYEYRQNITKYETILADDFEFIFDQQDQIDFGTPATFSKNEEQTFLINCYNNINSDESIELTLEEMDEQPDIILSDYAYIYRKYNLKLNHSVESVSQIATGWFKLHMIPDESGFWKIVNWADHRQDKWSWGRIKYEFSL